jgi:hypothetical protein
VRTELRLSCRLFMGVHNRLLCGLAN